MSSINNNFRHGYQQVQPDPIDDEAQNIVSNPGDSTTASLYETLRQSATRLAQIKASDSYHKNHPIIYAISQFCGGIFDSFFGPSTKDINSALENLVSRINVIQPDIQNIYKRIFSNIDPKNFSTLTPEQAIREMFKSEFGLTHVQNHEIDLLIYNEINETPLIGKLKNTKQINDFKQKLNNETTFNKRIDALQRISIELRKQRIENYSDYLAIFHESKKAIAIKNYLNKNQKAYSRVLERYGTLNTRLVSNFETIINSKNISDITIDPVERIKLAYDLDQGVTLESELHEISLRADRDARPS